MWGECPSEWEDPVLSQQMDILRSVLTASNKAIQVIRDRKVVNSSLEAEIILHTSSQEILNNLLDLESPGDLEYPLSDLLLVSKVTSSLQKEEAVLPSLLDSFAVESEPVCLHGDLTCVQVIAGPASEMSSMGKCGRCWRYLCEEGEELCGRCASVEGSAVETSSTSAVVQ